MKVSRWYTGVLISCIALALFTLGCTMPQMESRWRDRDITIDGIDNGPEWEYARYFIDKQQVTLGIMNDDDAVYLRLSSRDTAVQRTVLTGGLTIWFDESGGKDKTFGVHYPMGISESDTMNIPAIPMIPPGAGMRRGGVRGGGAIESEAIENAINGMLSVAGNDLEIISAGPDSTRITRTEASGYGIEQAISYSAGNLVYELRIPLHRANGNRFGITTNGRLDSFAMGFETGKVPEIKEPRARTRNSDAGNRMNPDDPDYEDDGMLMNTPRTRGSEGLQPSAFSPSQSKPIELWLTAHLAEEKK